MIFRSGFGHWKSDGTCIQGHVGEGLIGEESYAAARLCGLSLLATFRPDFGTLDGVERVVNVPGFMTSPPDSAGHSSVVERCTDLFVDLFGDEGRSTRSASRGFAVEIEAVASARLPHTPQPS